MQPILIQSHLTVVVLWIHASVHMLLTAKALAQHLLNSRLLTATLEKLLHGLLLFSDEVAQVDEVLVEINDTAHVD